MPTSFRAAGRWASQPYGGSEGGAGTGWDTRLKEGLVSVERRASSSPGGGEGDRMTGCGKQQREPSEEFGEEEEKGREPKEKDDWKRLACTGRAIARATRQGEAGGKGCGIASRGRRDEREGREQKVETAEGHKSGHW